MKYSVRVPATLRKCYSRNAGPVEYPSFWVPIRIHDRVSGRFDLEPTLFLWDTGASFCTVGKHFAEDYGLKLHPILDRVSGGIDGLGGNRDSWLTTMTVRFPLLERTGTFPRFWIPRAADLTFDFSVMVVDAPVLPLLGTSDMLRNFDALSTWDDCAFSLNADHLGTPIRDGEQP